MKNLAFHTLRIINLPLFAVSALALIAFALLFVAVLLGGILAVLGFVLACCLVLLAAALAVAVLMLPNILLVCILRAIKPKKPTKSDAPGTPHFMANN